LEDWNFDNNVEDHASLPCHTNELESRKINIMFNGSIPYPNATAHVADVSVQTPGREKRS
jgi:hypothetical protein